MSLFWAVFHGFCVFFMVFLGFIQLVSKVFLPDFIGLFYRFCSFVILNVFFFYRFLGFCRLFCCCLGFDEFLRGEVWMMFSKVFWILVIILPRVLYYLLSTCFFSLIFVFSSFA